MIARDLLVMGGALLIEQKSLPAFWRLAKCLPGALRSRRWIMSRRRASDENLAEWFSDRPSSRPITSKALPAKSLGVVSRGAGG
jgi:hypothetical protein